MQEPRWKRQFSISCHFVEADRSRARQTTAWENSCNLIFKGPNQQHQQRPSSLTSARLGIFSLNQNFTKKKAPPPPGSRIPMGKRQADYLKCVNRAQQWIVSHQQPDG